MKSNRKNPILSGILKFLLIIGIMGFLLVSACSGENTKDGENIEGTTDPAGTTSGDNEGIEEDMDDAADTTGTSPGTTIDTTRTRGTTE